MPILADPTKEDSLWVYRILLNAECFTVGMACVIKWLILATEKETFGGNRHMTLFYKVSNTEDIFYNAKINVLSFVS